MARSIVGILAQLAAHGTLPGIGHVLVDEAGELRAQPLNTGRVCYFITDLQSDDGIKTIFLISLGFFIQYTGRLSEALNKFRFTRNISKAFRTHRV